MDPEESPLDAENQSQEQGQEEEEEIYQAPIPEREFREDFANLESKFDKVRKT